MADQANPIRDSSMESGLPTDSLLDAVASIEVESWLQAERHITAAGFWGTFQWWAGGASAVLAAAASATAFNEAPVVAGVLALLAAGSAALVTALRPGDVSAAHLTSASQYNEIQNLARDSRDDIEAHDATAVRREIVELRAKWNAVTKSSPRVPRRLVRVSEKRFVARGLNYYPKPNLAG